MKKYLVMAVILGAGLIAWAQSVDSCDRIDRVGPVCRAMKNIRSHIMVLDSQRELVQANFEYMELTLGSLRQTIVNLMTGSYSSVHLADLQGVKDLAEQAMEQARLKNPEAFKVSNEIKTACQKCHNSDSAAGLKWEEVFKTRWEKTAERCNSPGRNPYVCRHMYGLFTIFENFETAYKNGAIDYKFAAANAQEIVRITDVLLAFSTPIHPDGNASLQELRADSVSLKEIAERFDPEVYNRGVALSQACIKCHRVQ